MTATRSLRRLLGVALFFAVLLSGSRPAGAGPIGTERIPRQEVDIVIEPTGDIVVTEVIEYDFGAAERHGIVRDLPVRGRFDDRQDRLYPTEVLSVKGSPGTPDRYDIEYGGPIQRLRIGDPDVTISGMHTYTISYRVKGALNAFADHNELYWDAIGDQSNVVVNRATVRVAAPADILKVACLTGTSGATRPCTQAKSEGRRATFSQWVLGPRQAVTVVVGFPTGVVPVPAPILGERQAVPNFFDFGDAFEVTEETLTSTLILCALLLIGFAAVMWRSGRDRCYRGSAVDAAFGGGNGQHRRVPLFAGRATPVEFVPPAGLTPGHVGLLADERAGAREVTATIIDLARRGYLRIEEIAEAGKPAHDWKLVKLKDTEDLHEHEDVLVEGLFRNASGSRTIRLSRLEDRFADRFAEVQNTLYQGVVDRGWFPRRPDKVRGRWAIAGFGFLVIGVVASVWAIAQGRPVLPITPFLFAGLLQMIGARWMPRRTPEGTAVLRRIRGFQRFIDDSEAPRARYAEQRHLFTEYLPYAIVFGSADRWAKTFVGLETPEPGWYVGARPGESFNTVGFASTMDSFRSTASSTLQSTPSSSGGSGFSGGFSGGGGGGGGIDSW